MAEWSLKNWTCATVRRGPPDKAAEPRFDSAIDSTPVFTANPDGTDE
jgi:hypothetical protein